MRFSPFQLERARTRHSLAQLIGRSVALKKRGREYEGLCPFHKEKTPSFHVVEEKHFYHCFGCGAHGDAITWIMWSQGASFPDAVRMLLDEEPEDDPAWAGTPVASRPDEPIDDEALSNRERAAALWKESMPIEGTLGDAYFRARGIADQAPSSLRFHPASPYGQWRRFPAIVGFVSDADRKFLGVWRIHLHPGRPEKAPVAKPKLGLGPVRGGSVHLSPIASGQLNVGEGIETCRAVRQRHPDIGVWAALSTSFMRKLVLPPIKELVVWEDRDAADPNRELKFRRPDGTVIRRRNPNFGKRAGHEAALFLCERAKREQKARTAIVSPGLGDGSDFNDVFREDAA